MRYLFGSKERDAIFAAEKLAAHKAGRGAHPICNLCDRPVDPAKSKWHRSHIGAAAWLGDPKRTTIGVAHASCNMARARRDRAEQAKSDRIIKKRQRRIPRHPLPGCWFHPYKRAIGGGRKPRQTLGERIAETRAKRALAPMEV